MINITKNKQLYRKQIIQQNHILELVFAKKIKPIMGRQWLDVAITVSNGIYGEIQYIIDRQFYRLQVEFEKQYRKIGVLYNSQINNRIEKVKPKGYLKYDIKQGEWEFWNAYNNWVKYEAVRQVTKINETTRNVLRGLISRSIEAGKSYAQIARDIRIIKDISNTNRARKIAVTETHSAFGKSSFESVQASRLPIENKEWVSAMDERTRTDPFDHIAANGEKVKMNDLFYNTNQGLRYPGDPDGSAGNIIYCRCVSLYNTN
jgi:hypothetical protein